MRIVALLLAGTAMIATVPAQAGTANVEFLPMSNHLPALLFTPDSLAGTLLRPFAEPASVAARDPIVIPANVSLPDDERLVDEPLPDPGLQAGVQPAAPQAEAAVPAVDLAEVSPDGPALIDSTVSAEQPVETGAVALAPEKPAPEELSSQEPASQEPASQEEEPSGIDVASLTPAEPPADSIPTLAPVMPAKGTVTVIVENVESASGSVNVAICDTSLSRQGCPYVHEVPAALGFVQTEFDGIPPGTYAVVGYHDVNANNEFDKLLGVPREPYALSNNASEKLIPTFKDASLKVNPGDNAVIIRLHRLGG